MKKILVTGATGFVGGAVLKMLAHSGDYSLRASVRDLSAELPVECEKALVNSLGPDVDWSQALTGVDVVIHSAARVHVMDEQEADPLKAYRLANVEGTLALAMQAVEAGAKRFVFVSSIKVNGESTLPGSPFTADDQPNPIDPYGVSKWEAEQALIALANDTGLEVVIVRPVLVYGPGVKANFLRMMRWLDKKVPLPLGAINNKRSLVALDNLADLICTCVEHQGAVNQTFLVSDDEDLSTTDLLKRLGSAMNRPAFLLPVPQRLMSFVAGALGKKAISDRLFGSLQVDISKTKQLLGWQPPVAVDDALKRVAKDFK